MDDASRCSHLREFLTIELDLISEHIDRHRWFQGIADEGEAIGDFIQKFGWLIREMHCKYVCSKKDCKVWQSLVR